MPTVQSEAAVTSGVDLVTLWRLFRSEKQEPDAFYRTLADHTFERFPFPLEGQRVLDLGCGPGYFTRAMHARGAHVVGTDLDERSLRADPSAVRRATTFVSDGGRLALRSSSVDGVFCSNVLEHTPKPAAILDEVQRVLRPGGWAYVSWTNWYSPWGGHAIAPFHYLGPRLGANAYRLVLGEPRGPNMPFVNLWITHIGEILRLVRTRPALVLVDAHPRYYPSQRWILRVPVLRELITWNCVLLLRRVAT